MGRPIHFEIHAEDPERALKFYSEIFGWEFTKTGSIGIDYWLITTGPKEQVPGINGGMLRRRGPRPAEGSSVHGYVVTIDVENIDESIAKVEQAGGKCQLPKQAMEGMAWFAYYHDTEGNIFGMWQNDPTAKQSDVPVTATSSSVVGCPDAETAAVGEKREVSEPAPADQSPPKKEKADAE